MTQEEAEEISGYKFTDGWEFVEIKREGELSGFVMKQGNELHVFRLPKFNGRWFVRRDIEAVFAPILREFGEAVTKVRESNKVGLAFCKRVGFEVVGCDDQIVTMKLKRMNHARH